MKWPGIQSEDVITYINGIVLKRKFIQWNEGVGYDLYITTKNGKSSFVKWSIEKLDEKSKITITIYPYICNQGNKIVNWIPFNLFVKPNLKNYLISVLCGLNYYLDYNKKVKKNQFGSHPWFSL